MKTMFKVLWDNGHASDALQDWRGKPTLFDTEEQADMAGRDWLYEMCAIDDDDPEDEFCPYQYEVIEAEIPDADDIEEAAAVEEQSLDYFNRYIAGDR